MKYEEDKTSKQKHMNTKYYYATSASIASKQKIIRYLKQSKQEVDEGRNTSGSRRKEEENAFEMMRCVLGLTLT